MIRLVGSDVDGTLALYSNTLSNANLEAIHRLQENNIDFLLVTGRAYSEAEDLLIRNNIHVGVCALNGACVYDINGQEVVSFRMSNEDARICHEVAKKFDVIALYHCVDRSYFEITTQQFLSKFKTYKELCHEDNSHDEFAYWQIDTHGYDMDFEEILTKGILKVEYVYLTEKQQADIFEALSTTDMAVTSSGFGNCVEATDRMADKGKALQNYVISAGISNDEVAVIGDGLNDAKMFEYFSNTTAMGNAHPKLKEMAKHVVAGVFEDGFAQFVNEVVFQDEVY